MIQVNPIVSPRIITIPEADGDSITIQSLVNQIRDWEDEQANLSYDKLLSAGGKEVLGGGVLVGITATLENAKLKFAARTSPTVCTVLGGNLVALDANGDPMSPIQYAENVLVTLSQSSSATLIETGVSGLSTDEHDRLVAASDIVELNLDRKISDINAQLMSLPDIVWADAVPMFLLKIIKNKKALVKNGLVWELMLYDDDNYTSILTKELKDKDGNNITDIAAGVLAMELKSSV